MAHPNQYQLADKDSLAAQLEVPSVFISVLARDGRFEPAAFAMVDTGACCKRCCAPLPQPDGDLCAGCAQNICNEIKMVTMLKKQG